MLLQQKLDQFLLKYRSTPHVSTKDTPAKLFLGREVRTKMDLIRPNIRDSMISKQSEQSVCNGNVRTFSVEDSWVRNYAPGEKWVPGKVVTCDGTRYYSVLVGDTIHRKHVVQLRENICDVSDLKSSVNMELSDQSVMPNQDVPCSLENSQPKEGGSDIISDSKGNTGVQESVVPDSRVPENVDVKEKQSPVKLRRSSRKPKPKQIIDV